MTVTSNAGWPESEIDEVFNDSEVRATLDEVESSSGASGEKKVNKEESISLKKESEVTSLDSFEQTTPASNSLDGSNIDSDLKDYILEHLKEGFNAKAVRLGATDAGWPESEIDEVFNDSEVRATLDEVESSSGASGEKKVNKEESIESIPLEKEVEALAPPKPLIDTEASSTQGKRLVTRGDLKSRGKPLGDPFDNLEIDTEHKSTESKEDQIILGSLIGGDTQSEEKREKKIEMPMEENNNNIGTEQVEQDKDVNIKQVSTDKEMNVTGGEKARGLNPLLKSYISDNLRRGFDSQAIRTAAIEAGWPESEVDSVLEEEETKESDFKQKMIPDAPTVSKKEETGYSYEVKDSEKIDDTSSKPLKTRPSPEDTSQTEAGKLVDTFDDLNPETYLEKEESAREVLKEPEDEFPSSKKVVQDPPDAVENASFKKTRPSSEDESQTKKGGIGTIRAQYVEVPDYSQGELHQEADVEVDHLQPEQSGISRADSLRSDLASETEPPQPPTPSVPVSESVRGKVKRDILNPSSFFIEDTSNNPELVEKKDHKIEDLPVPENEPEAQKEDFQSNAVDGADHLPEESGEVSSSKSHASFFSFLLWGTVFVFLAGIGIYLAFLFISAEERGSDLGSDDEEVGLEDIEVDTGAQVARRMDRVKAFASLYFLDNDSYSLVCLSDSVEDVFIFMEEELGVIAECYDSASGFVAGAPIGEDEWYCVDTRGFVAVGTSEGDFWEVDSMECKRTQYDEQ